MSDNAITRLTNNEEGYHSEVKTEESIGSTDCASDYKIARGMNILKVNSATKQGYEIAEEGDSINLTFPDSETRRGRVGKGVSQTLDTACNQGVLVVKHERTEEAKIKRKESLAKGKDSGLFSDRQMIAIEQDYSDTILANANPKKEGLIIEPKIGAFRGRNPENPKDRTTGAPMEQRLEINHNGTSNTITSVQKDNVVVEYTGISVHPNSKKLEFTGFKDGNCPALLATDYKAPKTVQFSNHRIRRLTVRECFRLMDFPDSFTLSLIHI